MYSVCVCIYVYIYNVYTYTYNMCIHMCIYIFKMYLDHDKTSNSQVRSEDRSLQTGILWILWLYGLDIHRYQGRYHVQDCSSGSFETFSSFFLKVESRISGQTHLRARYPISDTFPVRPSLPDPFFFRTWSGMAGHHIHKDGPAAPWLSCQPGRSTDFRLFDCSLSDEKSTGRSLFFMNWSRDSTF